MDKHREYEKSQPLRELEWLAQFFWQHGHDEMAKEIIDRLDAMNVRPQDFTNSKPQASHKRQQS